MKLLTTGFFDQINPSQLRFLESASSWGELYVGVGSDGNHELLKGNLPLYSQADRAQMVGALKCVSGVFLLDGSGDADFGKAIEAINPETYVASVFNDSQEKKALCLKHNLTYKVLRDSNVEQPASPNRYFPYRICMTGGWLDQPWVSKVAPGGVTVLGLEPDRDFMFRGGMATSTRETAKRIWSTFPSGDPENLARILFGAENPPGTKYVSGSQDALGLCLPGFSTLHYQGEYWPSEIDNWTDSETLDWLESVIWMVPLKERKAGYDPLLKKNLTVEGVEQLAKSTELAAIAVKRQDTSLLGEALKLTLESWKRILPCTVPDEYQSVFEAHDRHAGYNMSGCGGGYLFVISDQPVENAFQPRVRRSVEHATEVSSSSTSMWQDRVQGEPR